MREELGVDQEGSTARTEAPASDPRARNVTEDIYRVVKSAPEGIVATVTQIGGQVGVSYNVALKALHSLEAAGLIRSRHLGKTLGNRKKRYEVNPNSDERTRE